MKHLSTYLALILVMFACACSTSSERTAYATINTVGATINAAIGSYNDYTKLHGINPITDAEVKRAVLAYLQALETAKAAVISVKNGTANQTTADIALDAVTAASGNLVALITTITATR